MKPDLRNILQERFHGHEADVDPGLWEVIRSQITAPVAASDPIEELFRDRFQGHEIAVDPSAWTAISSQIGNGAAAGTAASGGSFVGWFAAASAVVILSVGAFLYNSTEGTPQIASTEEQRSVQVEGTISPSGPISPKEEVQPLVSVEEGDASEQSAAGTTTIEESRPAVQVEATPVHIRPSQKVQKMASPRTIEPRVSEPASTVNTESKVPEEGAAVVESVINKLAEEVHLESRTAEIPDPVGPPEVHSENADPIDRSTVATPDALPDIFLPNTFTPNSDGINDTYRVDLEGFRSMMIRIYSLADNRLVFSTDTNAEWDGANCEKGYYLVAIEAATEDGRIVTKGKAVWLNNDRY